MAQAFMDAFARNSVSGIYEVKAVLAVHLMQRGDVT
jgi:hypothetical protein